MGMGPLFPSPPRMALDFGQRSSPLSRSRRCHRSASDHCHCLRLIPHRRCPFPPLPLAWQARLWTTQFTLKQKQTPLPFSKRPPPSPQTCPVSTTSLPLSPPCTAGSTLDDAVCPQAGADTAAVQQATTAITLDSSHIDDIPSPLSPSHGGLDFGRHSSPWSRSRCRHCSASDHHRHLRLVLCYAYRLLLTRTRSTYRLITILSVYEMARAYPGITPYVYFLFYLVF